MREQLASVDAIVARIAARQHGVVTVHQLYAAGIDKDGVKRRIAAGRLHRVFRGVYAVGHAGLSNDGRWMAAVLACGEGAVLSHRSAAELWSLLPRRAGLIDVTIPTSAGRRRRRGIRLHRSPSLPNAATTRRNRIAVTTPARTLADLRRAVPAEQFRKAVRQAEFLGFDLGAIPTDGTRSELEQLLIRVCRRHRLSPPEVNAKVGRFTVDFLWRDRRLIVETDGYQGHGGRQAFEDDRAQDVELKLLGYEVVRFTHRKVTHDPDGVAVALRALLR